MENKERTSDIEDFDMTGKIILSLWLYPQQIISMLRLWLKITIREDSTTPGSLAQLSREVIEIRAENFAWVKDFRQKTSIFFSLIPTLMYLRDLSSFKYLSYPTKDG